ncbi:hypothetical protein J7K44_00685 [bacterium]|nr:hypothetical protein [bacterium]
MSSLIQQHIEIKDIKDDVVILKSGELRAILMASSLNFALKSTEEQDAICFRYQEFLNSLDFPVQIMISSRKFIIDPYIEMLEKKIEQQSNELLKIQTTEYIEFVKQLTETTNIMTESFYIVIPLTPPILAKKPTWIDKIFKKNKKTEIEKERFEQLKTQLWQRVEFVQNGLQNFGIRAVPLNTQELIELFYKLYNPSAKEEPELEKAKELRRQ